MATLHSNIRYTVTPLSTIAEIIQRTKQIIQQISIKRIIIYNLDVQTVEQIADVLDVVRYHNQYEKKKDVLQ
jgi:hypothetical protein